MAEMSAALRPWARRAYVFHEARLLDPCKRIRNNDLKAHARIHPLACCVPCQAAALISCETKIYNC